MLERFILRRDPSANLTAEQVAEMLHDHQITILDSGSSYHFVALDPAQSVHLIEGIRGWSVTRASVTPRPDTRQRVERRVVGSV